jgi:hypothetical protein
MAVRQLSDGGPAGTTLGQSASDLVSFHGATPVDQAASISLATNATIATTNVAVRAIIAALYEKGLIEAGPGA